MNIICDLSAFAAKFLTDSATVWAERLFIMNISASAPAASTAFAESYSQFVPGNTGISTLGLASLIAGFGYVFAVYSNLGISLFSEGMLQLYTLSSLFSYISESSSIVMQCSLYSIVCFSVTVPSFLPITVSSAISRTKLP